MGSNPVPLDPNAPAAAPTASPADDPQQLNKAIADFHAFASGRLQQVRQGGFQPPPVTPNRPAMIGQAPPNLTGGGPTSAPPPPPMPTMSVTPPAPVARKTGPAGGSIIDTVSGIINNHFQKKAEDKIAHAQNTLNDFTNAVNLQDWQTANLIANPKNIEAWKKYLNREFERVPGEAVPNNDQAMGQAATAPGINQPGGIAVPRNMTPQAEVQQKTWESANRVMDNQSDAQRATNVLGDMSMLSSDQFKQATLSKYGLALTQLQYEQMDTATRMKLAEMQFDYAKIMDAKAGDYASAENVAKINAAARSRGQNSAVDAARVRGAYMLKAVKERNATLQKIADGKPDAVLEGLYKVQLQDADKARQDAVQKLNTLGPSGIGNLYDMNGQRAALQQQVDYWDKKAKKVQQDLNDFKITQDWLKNAASDEQPDNSPDTTQEPEP
jgi:hypothetical protein